MVTSCVALGGSAAAAPKYLGPNKCVSCHDHEIQKTWSAKDKHSRALQQLEDAKASKYAAAIGLSDQYDLKGSCVACHATVFSGDANAGVSCEKCHGPGSDYLEPHQQKGSYTKAVSLGMIDTRGNYPAWAALCVNCHVVTDAKLTAAGHKSGADFEVGAESRKIVHWKETYDFARLSAGGKAASARRAGGAPPPAGAAPKLTATPAPTKPPKPTPTATPVAKEPRATPTSAPAARPEAARSPTASPPRRESPTPRVMAPATPTVPPPTEPAARAETQPAPSAPPTEAPSRADIVIVIRATPIPTVSPQVGEKPTAVPKTILTTAPEAEPRPSATRRPTILKKPRPKPTVRPRPPATVSIPREPSPLAVAKSAPSPTRTRVPAPRRTLRAPH